MQMYYWENPNGYGEFQAENSDEACRRIPKNCLMLYTESDTKDGLPFIDIEF